LNQIFSSDPLLRYLEDLYENLEVLERLLVALKRDAANSDQRLIELLQGFSNRICALERDGRRPCKNGIKAAPLITNILVERPTVCRRHGPLPEEFYSLKTQKWHTFDGMHAIHWFSSVLCLMSYLEFIDHSLAMRLKLRLREHMQRRVNPEKGFIYVLRIDRMCFSKISSEPVDYTNYLITVPGVVLWKVGLELKRGKRVRYWVNHFGESDISVRLCRSQVQATSCKRLERLVLMNLASWRKDDCPACRSIAVLCISIVFIHRPLLGLGKHQEIFCLPQTTDQLCEDFIFGVIDKWNRFLQKFA